MCATIVTAIGNSYGRRDSAPWPTRVLAGASDEPGCGHTPSIVPCGMTRTSLLVSALSLLLGGASHAQAPEPPENVVFLDLGLHVIGAGYQRTVSPRVALSVSTGLYDAWTATDAVGDVRGGYLRLRPYVFLVGAAPRGVWVSPFVQGALVSAKTSSGEKSGLAGAVGLAVGYAFLFGDLVHLSLGGGAQYHAAETFDGLHWHVDATLGLAF